MTHFNIIPAIDLLDNQVVRLKQGKYDTPTFYKHSPLDLAKLFQDSGAKRLHIVDLNGARDGSRVHGHIIESIRSNTSLEIEVGGGIRTNETVSFYINAGVNQLILGSLLIDNFDEAIRIVKKYPNAIIAGIDAKQSYVATSGWETTSSTTIESLLNKINSFPFHSVIYTDIAKDGMMSGPNIDMLKHVSEISTIPIIASGGIRNKQDVTSIQTIKNINGCIIGKAILGNLSSLPDFF